MTATLTEQRREHLQAVSDIAAKAQEDGRTEFTADEDSRIKELMGKANDLKTRADRAKSVGASVAEAQEFLSQGDAEELNDAALQGAQKGASRPGKGASIGERFAKSAEFQDLMKKHNGHISDSASVRMNPMDVGGGFKALVTSGGIATEAGDASGLVTPPQRLGLLPYTLPELVLRNFITNATTNSDKIEYAQFLPSRAPGGSVNNARGVKEATGIDDGSGRKPESSLRFRKASAEVITLAHYMPATRRALSDVGQLRSIIDQFLVRGLDEKVTDMILNGDKDAAAAGAGDYEEWDGILKTDGTLAQAAETNSRGANHPLKAIRRAIRKVRDQGANVTAVLVSPELDEYIDLLEDSTGRFLGQGPWSMGPGTIWGVPRVVAPELAGKGKFVLGDLTTCTLWDRESAQIYATDAHADWFTRNLIAILAELRAGFGVFTPSHLVIGEEGDLGDADDTAGGAEG